MKVYKCESCGKLLLNLGEKNGALNMTEVVPGSVDAAAEKHVPVVAEKDGLFVVAVGEVLHPALEEHHIAWIALETEKGLQVKYITPGEKPEAVFAVAEDKALAAYAYCNLHGLWKKEL